MDSKPEEDLEDEEYFYEECGEEEIVVEEPSIYDPNDFISGPILSKDSTIKDDILTFDFSYGYNCRKYFNMCCIDEDTIVFSSGNFLNFFNVQSRDITFRRSANGRGIGHIRENPNPEYRHMAVAENGTNPIIIIYEWPNLEINCILKEGSTNIFTHLDYSPDGMLLVSQAGDPDYMITIFNWPKHRILLRTKSYVNDVYRVMFSPYCPGQLTSAGVAHIKFWKMALTFTGLKLKGELGRFGKTEYSDILGVLPMPDEKVLSGASWGNILVWDGGLIKLEVLRTLRRKCHEAPIVQFFYMEGELWTVGMDGHVKIWWYEKIDQADPSDEDRVVQLEPTYDFYTSGVMLMYVKKRYREESDTFYFGQDGNGGLWLLDLNFEQTPKPAIQLYKCHGGEVMDLAAHPRNFFFATLGVDGRLFVYNYLKRKIVFCHQFPAKGSCMIWMPLHVRPTADEIVFGFDDGNLRCCIVNLNIKNEKFNSLKVIQVIKPHNRPVTAISINEAGTVLVSGSADATVFVFQIIGSNDNYDSILVPIGFVPVPDTVSYLTWKPNCELVVVVGCLHGHFAEIEVPDVPQDYTLISYQLKIKPDLGRFVTYKAQIRRDIHLAEVQVKKDAKLIIKMQQLEKVKQDNPGMEIDEEVFLADSDDEEELEPLHIPEVPNDILWMQYTPNDTWWLSLTGYDAGYIYEYTVNQKEDIPLRFKMIDHADDTEIYSFVYNDNKKYLIFAMQDGSLRVNKVNPNDFTDLHDYFVLPMHENLQGFIPKMAFSFDEKYFFTCGYDGNVFSMLFKPEHPRDYINVEVIPAAEQRIIEPQVIEDYKAYDRLSLEETMVKAENDRIEKVANENKQLLRTKIKHLTKQYSQLLARNNKLIQSQIISREYLEIDERINNYLEVTLEKQVALVRRKLAYDVAKAHATKQKLINHFIYDLDRMEIAVKAIDSPAEVRVIRQRRINPKLYNLQAVVEMKIREAELKGREPERVQAPTAAKVVKKKRAKGLEYFLLNISPSVIQFKFGSKLTRILEKYRERKQKWEDRQDVWEEFMTSRPLEGVNHPDDVKELEIAEKSIGDYKLKSHPKYKVPPHLRGTTSKKCKELLETRRKEYDIRHGFNEKVFQLREKKKELRKKFIELHEKLARLHQEIPKSMIKHGPQIPPEDASEYPETTLFSVYINIESEEKNELEKEYAMMVEKQIKKHVKMPDAEQTEKEILVGLDIYENQCMDPFTDPRVKEVCQYNFSQLMELSQEEFTPWDAEVLVLRTNRKLFEQEEILHEMTDKINSFNSEVDELKKERLQVQVDAYFIDLFFLTLHQELIIIKDCESVEEVLSDKLNHRKQQVNDMEDVIDDLNERIEGHTTAIERLHEQEKHVYDNFAKVVHDHKFESFLGKVFKKKYKPPKVRRGDESSSESSSSSSSDESEEDDAKSIDSRDFGIIKQDLNVCPKGCDQETFDTTIALRTERHQMEIKVRENQSQIEILKKDLEINNKKKRVMIMAYQQSQEELEIFQSEKQQKLNEIHCTVLLNLNQFQHLSDTADFKISNTLVFSKSTLTKLYQRVGELRYETLQHSARHKDNIKHLMRMKKDMEFMHRRINQLKEEMVELSEMKFGRSITMAEIDEALRNRSFGDDFVTELYETMLKRMVHDVKLSLMDIKSMYNDEIKRWKDKVGHTHKLMAETLRENTSKLELLSLLNREKVDLSQILANQEAKREQLTEIKTVTNENVKEVEKLECILQGQKIQMQQLKAEIQRLKTKGLVRLDDQKLAKREDEEKKASVESVYEGFMCLEDMFPLTRPEKDAKAILGVPTEKVSTTQVIITEVINDMLEQLMISMETSSTDNFVKQIISQLLRRSSVECILNELVKGLPVFPSNEQMKAVEIAAEKITGLEDIIQLDQELMEELQGYVTVIIDNIVEEVLDLKSSPSEIILDLVYKLLEQLPSTLLDENLDYIAEKISDYFDKSDIPSIRSTLDEVRDDDVKTILQALLERVFGVGIDYLHYIKL